MKTAEDLFKMWYEKPTKISAGKSAEKPAKKAVKKTAKAEKPIKKSVEISKDAFNGRDFSQAVKNIQKSAERNGLSREFSTFMKGKHLFILDNYRILKCKYPFITAPKNPKGLDVDRFFTDAHNRITGEKFNAPTIPELKKMIAEAKEDYCRGLSEAEIRRLKRKGKLSRVLYQFDNGLTVNADYLIDALALTRKTEFSFTGLKYPLIFQSDDGNYEMALCPVNSQEKFKGACKVA